MMKLPKGWCFVSLVNDLPYVKTGVVEYEGTKKYYSTGSIQNKSFKEEGEFVFSEKPSRANRIGFVGDVFQARMKATDKAFIIDSYLQGHLFSTGFFQIRPIKNLLNGKYIFYFLTSLNFNQIKDQLCSGSTQSALNDEGAEKILMPLPSFAEQHRIVAKIEELFSSLDKGIEDLKTAQAQLKIYRQAVLKWAFEGKLTNKNVKDGELPEGWEWVKFGSLMATVKNGYSLKPDDKGEFKILRISSVRPLKIDITDFRLLIRNIGKENSVEENDLLFTRYNGSVDFVGVSARVPKINGEIFYPDKLIRCRPINRENYHSKYLLYATNSIVARQFILSKIKTTAGQTGISGSEIKGIPIPITSDIEQEKIVFEIEKRLSVCDKIEESIIQSLEQAEALRQSILKKAFEGKLVPQDPNDEPASVLLERIRAEREAAKAVTGIRKTKGHTK